MFVEYSGISNSVPMPSFIQMRILRPLSSDIDGRKVKLVVDDTESNNVKTLSAVRKLSFVNKAQVILGPTWLDSFQSVLPIADRERILLFSPSTAIAVIKQSNVQYPFVLSTYFNLEVEIELLLKHLKSQQKNSELTACPTLLKI